MLKEKKVSLNVVVENLYLIAIFIYTFGRAFRSSLIIDFPRNITRLMYLITIVLCIPKIITNKYNKKELIISILIMFTGVLAFYFYPKKRDLLAIPLVLIGVKNSDIKKIVKIVFAISLFFVILHTSAYFVDHFINGGNIFNIPFFDRSEDRSTVLCKYYNDYGAVTSMATMQYLYLTDRNNNRYLKFVVLLLISGFIYAVGTSRTSLIISVLALIYLPLENSKIFTSKLKLIKIITFFVVIVLCFSFFYVDLNNGLVSLFNKLMSGRIYLSNAGYKEIGLSLFPQLDVLAKNTLGFDIFVVYIALYYGLVILTLILSLTGYLSVFRDLDNITDYFIIIMFVWALSGRFNYYVTLTIVPMIVMNSFYRKS